MGRERKTREKRDGEKGYIEGNRGRYKEKVREKGRERDGFSLSMDHWSQTSPDLWVNMPLPLSTITL